MQRIRQIRANIYPIVVLQANDGRTGVIFHQLPERDGFHTLHEMHRHRSGISMATAMPRFQMPEPPRTGRTPAKIIDDPIPEPLTKQQQQRRSRQLQTFLTRIRGKGRNS